MRETQNIYAFLLIQIDTISQRKYGAVSESEADLGFRRRWEGVIGSSTPPQRGKWSSERSVHQELSPGLTAHDKEHNYNILSILIPQQGKGKHVVCLSSRHSNTNNNIVSTEKHQTRGTRQTPTAAASNARTHLDTALRSHHHLVRVNLEVLESLQLALVHDATQSLHQHVTPLVDNAILHHATRDVAHLCVRACVRVFCFCLISIDRTCESHETNCQENLRHKRQNVSRLPVRSISCCCRSSGRTFRYTTHTSCEIDHRE